MLRSIKVQVLHQGVCIRCKLRRKCVIMIRLKCSLQVCTSLHSRICTAPGVGIPAESL